jgi:hypothetical protein
MMMMMMMIKIPEKKACNHYQQAVMGFWWNPFCCPFPKSTLKSFPWFCISRLYCFTSWDVHFVFLHYSNIMHYFLFCMNNYVCAVSIMVTNKKARMGEFWKVFWNLLCEEVQWVKPADDTVQFLTLVDMIMNLSVHATREIPSSPKQLSASHCCAPLRYFIRENLMRNGELCCDMFPPVR